MKTFLVNSICIFFLTVSTVVAQDIHFSQMRFSQLNVNPALAGAEQSLQAVANFREQWNSVAAPFTTIGAAVDLRIREQQARNGFFALGLNFFNDVAGDVRMTTTNVSLALAYHLYVGDKSTIGVALQGGYGQRGIGSPEGTWATQFVGTGFDMDRASGELFQESSFSHLDVGGGLVYRYSRNEGYMRGNDHFDLSSGVAVYHANRPSNTFLANGEDDLAMRLSAFAHANFGIGASNWSLLPALYYNRQGGHQEILAGTYARILIREASKRTGFLEAFSMSTGLFYRLQDAFVAKLMLEYSNYSLGISYDFNASGLTAVSRGRGGVEFFLRFVLPQPIGVAKKTRIN
jgi:type IX secretion system PorP/SprF family membrane protein